MILRVYRIRPWEMERYTPNEMRAIDRDLKKLADAARSNGG